MKGETALARALNDVGRPLRGMHGLVYLFGGVAAAVMVLALVAWWARITHAEITALVLWAWGLAVSALLVGFWLGRRTIRTMGPHWVATALEATGAWRRGAVTNVLDDVAPETSRALRAKAEQGAAAAVAERGPNTMLPALVAARRLGRYSAAAVVGSVVLLLAARPLVGAPARLWRPWAALASLTSPVQLEAKTPDVRRGEAGVFSLTATGHRNAVLYTRAPGEAWRATPVALDSRGRGEFTTLPLSAELIGRLEAGGRSSEEVRIGIRLPAFLGSVMITAHYPDYLGLASEALPLSGESLILPDGTRLEVVGRATVPLGSATLVGGEKEVGLEVDGTSFRGDFHPTASGEWQLQVRSSSGQSLDGDLPHLSISVVPDSAPAVVIPVPGADTVAGATLTLEVLVDARDDHGLTTTSLEVRRGRNGTAIRLPLNLGAGTPARALVPATVDLAALGMHAGDTLFYLAQATDNAPARHLGRSREYWARFPTESELRQAREGATNATGQGLDSLVRRAEAAQRQAEDLTRERVRNDATTNTTGKSTEPMRADAARKAEAVVRNQDEMLKDAERIARELEQLRTAAEKQGLADSSFAKQLDEIRRLMQQADTPELRDAMAALQEALKQLDPEAMRTAMKDVAQRQAEFKNAMEQARELFKRAALEGDLANLQQDAKDLSTAQKELTPQLADAAKKLADSTHAPGDSSARKRLTQQEQLAARADSLAGALSKAASKVPSDSVKAGLQRAAEQVRNASDQMQQAAGAAKSGQSQAAEASAKSAQEKLAKVEQEVKEQKENLQEKMKEEVLEALDRTLKETSRLAQREVAIGDLFRRGSMLGSNRTEQSLIDDGVGRLITQMSTIASLNAMVPQQIGVALAASRVSMRNAIEAVSSVTPDPITAATEAGEAVDALLVAAFAMLRAKDRVGGAASGSGMQEAMQEMQQAAEQQRKAAGQTGQQLQSGESSMQQMMQMAMQQRAIATQLDRMQASGQIQSAGVMAKEAKELAREIEAGQLTRETADRQEKLYRRMLDAGRQLQGGEENDEKNRKATTAQAGAVRTPPPLDPRLRQGELGIQFPGWDVLQRFSPEERRRVLDYFQRLTEIKRP